MSELITKDSGGWTPLDFASHSGSRSVFVAMMKAFIERGEEGSQKVSFACKFDLLSVLSFFKTHAWWGVRGPRKIFLILSSTDEIIGAGVLRVQLFMLHSRSDDAGRRDVDSA